MAWVRVTKRKPCPVCQCGDYCTMTADGAMVNCMRVESQNPSANKLGGWLHKLADPVPVLVRSLPKRPRPVVDWTEAARQMYLAGAQERGRLATELGLKIAALEDLCVGAGFDRYRGLMFSSWPERDATGRVVGIVRRYRDGAKKTMQGSCHGLYYGRHPFALPGPVLLPEGGSDTCVLLGIGLNAIGRPSNMAGVELLTTMLVGTTKPIVVLAEDDKKADGRWPGMEGARLTAERLSAALKRHVSVKMFPRAKDARDWCSEHPEATAIEATAALYSPERDCCRVCHANGPHEERIVKDRIEVVCRLCRTLLENKPL